MDGVQEKYINFCKLCNDISKDNEWVIELQKTPSNLFLIAMKSKYSEDPRITIDEIYNQMINKAKILDKDIKDDHRVKLKRYIDYFSQIVALC